MFKFSVNLAFKLSALQSKIKENIFHVYFTFEFTLKWTDIHNGSSFKIKKNTVET